MFIKRFYSTLLDHYFMRAIFAKPTGDGLLLIFRYTENDLHAVSDYVISTCIQVIKDFPTMFRNDPMINFSTPSAVGFGISRGPSCCLFSGRTILDYSGQLLNLAARLNDLARPQGIVIAGSYLRDVIPENLRTRFRMEQVYLRGISEDTPIEVFCSKAEVVLPGYALNPISMHDWQMVTKEFTVAELQKMVGTFTIDIPSEPISRDKTKMEIRWENTKLPGYTRSMLYDSYEYFKDATGHHLQFELDPAKASFAAEKLKKNAELCFQFQYVPKPSSTTRGTKKGVKRRAGVGRKTTGAN